MKIATITEKNVKFMPKFNLTPYRSYPKKHGRKYITVDPYATRKTSIRARKSKKYTVKAIVKNQIIIDSVHTLCQFHQLYEFTIIHKRALRKAKQTERRTSLGFDHAVSAETIWGQ